MLIRDRNSRSFVVASGWVLLLIALPWLNPFSPGPTPSVPTWLWSVACAALLLLTHSFLGSSSARSVAPAWLLAALLSVLASLIQYFEISDLFSPWVNTARAGEAYANLRQRNHFATLTNIGLAALVWGMAGRANKNRWHMFALVFAAALLGIGNAASSSRTGLLQLGLLLVLALWWRRAWRSTGVVSAALVLVAIVSFALATWLLPLAAGLDPNSSGILGRVNENVDACFSRRILWSNVLHLIAQKPWWGWGWGELDYAHFITLYPGERFCDILDNAHNLPLHLAVELGVPFAVLVCSFCAWLIARAKPWQETQPQRQMAWAVIALIGLHSMLEYPLWYGPFQIALALSILVLVRTSYGHLVTPQEYWHKRPPSHTALASLAIVIIASAGYTAWDYWRVSQIYLPHEARAVSYREDTLTKLQDSRLFEKQVKFAQLTTTGVTPANATLMLTLAKELLHFSPEPRVVEKVIESASILGRIDEAQFYLDRYKAAFPKEYERVYGDSDLGDETH
jgi:O-antigen ligase